MKFAFQIGVLFLFYYVGVWIKNVFELPIPGSIIGMLMLFSLLFFRILPVNKIDIGSTFLLNHFPLLFIPVTVGIIQYLSFFKGKGMISILVVLLSTALVMYTGGVISQKAALKKERGIG